MGILTGRDSSEVHIGRCDQPQIAAELAGIRPDEPKDGTRPPFLNGQRSAAGQGIQSVDDLDTCELGIALQCNLQHE